uniref:Putative secreted protein n=1 Tax=Ixodes ricinus TaxID=34613 RepID=A0A131Y4L8_IXORI
MWANSLISLPELSVESREVRARWRQPTVCKLPRQKRRTFFAISTRLFPVCMGLREFCQTVAVGLSTFRGRKAENTAAAPSHTACTVVSNASTVLRYRRR